MNAFFWSFIGVWKRWSNYIFNMKRFIENVLRSTLSYANETSKECIQFLNKRCQQTKISFFPFNSKIHLLLTERVEHFVCNYYYIYSLEYCDIQLHYLNVGENRKYNQERTIQRHSNIRQKTTEQWQTQIQQQELIEVLNSVFFYYNGCSKWLHGFTKSLHLNVQCLVKKKYLIFLGIFYSKMWVPNKQPVNRNECTCSCWDTVFKGIFVILFFLWTLSIKCHKNIIKLFN